MPFSPPIVLKDVIYFSTFLQQANILFISNTGKIVKQNSDRREKEMLNKKALQRIFTTATPGIQQRSRPGSREYLSPNESASDARTSRLDAVPGILQVHTPARGCFPFANNQISQRLRDCCEAVSFNVAFVCLVRLPPGFSRIPYPLHIDKQRHSETWLV